MITSSTDARTASTPSHGTSSPSAHVAIAVVIVNFRTPKLVEACLRKLVPELDALTVDACAVAMENGSGDESASKLSETIEGHGWRERVRLVVSERNTGFAGGSNIGIASILADAYLLLNSDTLLRPGALSALHRALVEHPEAGLVGPRLEWPDGRPQISGFRFHSPASKLIRGAATDP